MNEVIDVESYEIAAQSIVHDNIDVVFHNNALFSWMHSHILLGIAFLIHSKFYRISAIRRPSCAMD